MKHPALRWFEFAHLPPDLQPVSKACHGLAEEMAETLPAGMQRDLGLQRLVEAKDCFVRAALERRDLRGGGEADAA